MFISASKQASHLSVSAYRTIGILFKHCKQCRQIISKQGGRVLRAAGNFFSGERHFSVDQVSNFTVSRPRPSSERHEKETRAIAVSLNFRLSKSFLIVRKFHPKIQNLRPKNPPFLSH